MRCACLPLALVLVFSCGAQTQDNWLSKALGTLSPAEDKPQTAGQRFHDYAVSTIGPLAIISEAASAGIGQWRDSPHEWGQGGSGYGKRFGNNMAYNAVRTTLTYSLAEAFR